jgi:glycerol-3-phosphate dehydrogenase
VGDGCFDLVVVGGGINGCGVARDAARRGLRVALVEQDDWCAGTTRWSTRLIHGGLRYLEHGDVRLVRESLVERERLLATAAHLVRPLHLVIPVRRTSPFGLLKLRAGMAAYDVLSAGKSLDRHRMLGRTAAAAFEPGIALHGLRGAAVYADAQVALVERLCVENVLDAAGHTARCLNHTRAIGLLREGGRVAGVRCTDTLDGRTFDLRATVVANMAGPWVDAVRELGDASLQRRLGGTRGCHLVLPAWDGAPREALYVAARSDGRAFEICRWRHWMLVGTTDEPFAGDPGAVPVEPWEIDYLLAEVNAEFPRARLGREEVFLTTGGQRPLLRQDGRAPGAITRAHTIADGADEGVPGLLSAIGGKVTTYRQLAEEVVDRVVSATGRPARPCDTASALLPGAPGTGGDAVLWRERTILELAHRAGGRATAEHLVDAYGTRADAVLRRAEAEPALAAPLVAGRPELAAEVAVAVEEEGARTVEDVVYRRTLAGVAPGVGLPYLWPVARLCEDRYGWPAEDQVVAAHAAANRDFRKGLDPLPLPVDDVPHGRR